MKTTPTPNALLCVLFLSGCPREAPPDASPPGECSEEEFEAVSAYLLDPLLTDESPWTCTQCHDAGINPLMWQQETACQTMACFQENSLVDFEEISDSEILFFIHQAEAFGNVSTDLSLVRQRELLARMHKESETYSRWMNYAAGCFEQACSEAAQTYEGSCAFQIDWGSCDPDAEKNHFEEVVYDPLVEQCSGCHSREGANVGDNPSAPHFLEQDLAAGPSVTLTGLFEHFLISPETPATSKILTRPLTQGSTATTSLGEVTGVWHGGGDLWGSDDERLQELADWILRYTQCITP